MFLYRRYFIRLVAIGVSALLVLAVVGPGVAAACEGAGEVEGEIEGKKKDFDCPFGEEVGRTCTVKFDVENQEGMFGAWSAEPAGYTVEKKASCENKNFAPGNNRCEIAIKLAVEKAASAVLKIPVKFLNNLGMEVNREEVEIKLLNP